MKVGSSLDFDPQSASTFIIDRDHRVFW